VKKLARLLLFFSLSFLILLAFGTGLRFLALRVQWMRSLPAQSEAVLRTLIVAARWALSLALYGAILFSLSYIARQRIFALAALPCVIVLALALSFGVSLGLERGELLPPQEFPVKPLGGAGLILNQAQTSIVLLKGPEEARSPRVIAFADRPLLYQANPVGPNNSAPALPSLPLGSDSPWFLKSLAIDLRLNAEHLQERLAAGTIPFFIYAGALVFFLASLGFLFKLSVWPLANLFMGCLVFRLILSLETFFNSPEMRLTFESFLGSRLPGSLTVPLIFCGFGILVYIYSALVYLAQRRRLEEDY
jgi:hypothetical protein